MRANGGGNVSRMLIERLRRQVLALGFSRTDSRANTYPDGVFRGPMVAILNENSASDGDIFPAMFREAKLGPLIGKRSWGGVVGITNRGTLIDGGIVNVPEFGFATAKGEWIDRGLRRRSRHRGRERSEVGHRRPGSAARARRRRGR